MDQANICSSLDQTDGDVERGEGGGGRVRGYKGSSLIFQFVEIVEYLMLNSLHTYLNAKLRPHVI